MTGGGGSGGGTSSGGFGVVSILGIVSIISEPYPKAGRGASRFATAGLRNNSTEELRQNENQRLASTWFGARAGAGSAWDLALNSTDGLDLIKDIKGRHPNVIMLAVSMHDETLFAVRAMRNGASGHVSKREASHILVRAIHRVLAGEVYLSEQMANQIAANIVRRPRRTDGLPVEDLSDRELQVFQMLGTGRSTRDIAAALHLDISTVDSYRARLKDKLGVANASELLRATVGWTNAFRCFRWLASSISPP